MNSLSWMIYLASIAGSLSIALVAVGIALIIGGVVCVMRVDLDNIGREKKLVWPRWPFLVAAPLFIFAALLPSERAVYLIGASQMGEKVIEDPATAEMMRDVREIISSKLKEMKAKK